MKRVIRPSSRGLLIVYRLALGFLLILIVILTAGTMYGLIRKDRGPPLFHIGASARAGGQGRAGSPDAAAGAGGATGVFTGIGRLRIPVAGASSSGGGTGASTLILSIAFPYPPRDQAFSEELASRITDFRAIAGDYFSSLSAESLAGLNEETAKAELLRRYNGVLRLGKIETLYFNDFLIVGP